MKLEGSLAVVTGASSGIGSATARALAAQGVRVVLVARRSPLIEQLAADIERAGGRAHAVAADLGRPEDVTEMARHIVDDIGVPDIVINNAGAGRFLFIEETSPAEAVEMMQAPYFAAFFTTRAFIEAMIARGSGTVLMLNSPVAYMPWPGAVGYAAARWAVRGFTEALRQDLRTTGVRVSSVTPTKVHSEYFTNNPGAEERIPSAEKLLGSTTPEAVADVIVRALRRDSRDVFTPWRWGLTQPFARAFPRALAAFTFFTGARRPRA